MKVRNVTSVLFLSILLGCGIKTPPQPPQPPPTPSPAPSTAPTAGPLQAEADGTWTRDGKPWKMRMVVVCCKGYPDADPRDLAKSQNWPLTSKEFVGWISHHAQNATEVRPFMSPIHEGGPFFSPYHVATPDLKVDLDRWNPEFWAYLDDLLADGERHGVVFMVGVFDTWPQEHGLSPWCGNANVNGVNHCDDRVLRGPINDRGLAFARKVFEETGKHRNVIYQDGNESFEGMSGSWTLGMRDLLRVVEAERGYVRHPYGTQQRDDGLRAAVDFVSAEQDGPSGLWCGGSPRTCKPTVVNEAPPLGPAQVLRNVYRADALRTSFAFWMGDQSQDDRGRTLVALEGWARGEGLPVWARAAERCPSVARIGAKVHQHVCQNRTVPEPCVGGTTVVDSTPRYGPVGSNGKECNDEHDNCGGRVCEPPDGPEWEWSAPRGVRCFVQNPAHCEDTCTGVPCRPDRGYQLRCENEQPGDYEATPVMRDAVDCEGQLLSPRLTRGETVRWTVN